MTDADLLFYNMEQCIRFYPFGCTPEAIKLSLESTHLFCIRYPELVTQCGVVNFDSDQGYNHRLHLPLDITSENVVECVANLINTFGKNHPLVLVGHCQNFDPVGVMGENSYRIDVHMSMRVPNS